MELLGLEIPLWIPLTLLVLYLFKKYSTATYDTWSKQGIPGPPPIPLIGNTWRFFTTGNFANVEMKLIEQYGNKVGMYNGRQPMLCTNDPEFIRLACIKEFSCMPNRRDFDLGPLLNHFLTILRGDHWKHVRSAITPTFTTGKLKQMKPLVDDCVNRLMKHVSAKEGTDVEVKKLCEGFAADVIASTAFGIEVDSQTNPESEVIVYGRRIIGSPLKNRTFFKKAQRALRIGLILMLPPKVTRLLNQWGVRLFDQESLAYFESLVSQILEEKQEDRSESKKNFVQLCSDQIVEADPKDPHTQYDAHGSPWTPKGLTKLDVVGNAVIFFLAGFETTSTTLHYTLFELAHNKDVQEKAYNEITTHCSSYLASYEELSKLHYLDWIVRETLRLYSIPRLERNVEEEVTIQNVTLPKGSSFIACAQAVHYNPDIWPNPKEFDPERFSPENREGRHPCAWIPFGVGNRNCIGMRLALLEMKAALTSVIWNFTVEKTETTQERPILDYMPNFQLHPKSPITLKFTKRSD